MGGKDKANQTPWWYFDVHFPDSTGQFSFQEWSRHSSWLRYCPEPRILVIVVANMLPILVWVTLVTVGITLYYELGQMKHEHWLVVVSQNYNQPFLLTSFALALLLVFRTNSAYERWWSARKNFGQMYNDCRTLARFIVTWMVPKTPELSEKLLDYISMLGPASCSYILEDHMAIFDACLEYSFSDVEYEAIANSEQPPITILMIVSAALKACDCISTFERIAMEDRLTSYQIELGQLERIKNQPIYTPYTRQTSRFLFIYLTFLPCALVAHLSWAAIGVMPVLAFLLVGIDNIGIKAENPFFTLPIYGLAKSSKNTVQVIRRTSTTPSHKTLIAALLSSKTV